VKKNHGGSPRYDVKHYIFHRNSDRIDEITGAQVQVVDVPGLETSRKEANGPSTPAHHSEQNHANIERAKDQEFFSESFLAIGLAQNSRPSGPLFLSRKDSSSTSYRFNPAH
jgi:hypothetical protein